MRVLLINTPDGEQRVARDMAGGLGFDRGSQTQLPPLDLVTYASVLKARGHSVDLIDAQAEAEPDTAVRKAIGKGPEAILLTVSLPSLDHDLEFSRLVRSQASGSCRIVAKTGVRHPPVVARILAESGADACLLGECDLIIDEVLQGRTATGVVTAQVPEEREGLLRNLDLLPLLDWNVISRDRYRYPGLGQGVVTLQTSRGCPFSCGYYCPYPLVQGKAWRAMSSERVVAEMAAVAQAGGGAVLFRDATFTLNQRRAHEICSRLQQRAIRLRWWCETRADCLDDELLARMRESGCVGINLGVETGDSEILESTAKRGVTLDLIAHVRERCRTLGIQIRFLLMLGLPGETRQTLHSTFSLVRDLVPDHIGVTTVTPYPGTAFHADALANGWIVDPDLNHFGGHGLNVTIPPLREDDLRFALDQIHAVHRTAQAPAHEGESRELSALFERWSEGGPS